MQVLVQAMSQLRELLDYRFLDNPLSAWAMAVAVFAVTFLVVPFVRGRIRAHRKRWSGVRKLPGLDLLSLLVSRTSRLILLVVALYLAEKILKLPVNVDRVLDVIIIVGAWVQVGIWATTAVRFLIERRSAVDGSLAKTSVAIVMFGAQLLLWAVFVLLALDNLGVNITALVAGLGVGGVAVALAVQTLLGDLFASLSIAFDKPFQIGDQLRVDDYEGTVEHIGLKSTRLRSVTGEQIILSNADVLKSRVRNLGRMAERRLMFRLPVSYDTAPEKLDEVPRLVEKVISGVEGTRYVQCVLVTLGTYALEFETIYFIRNEPRYGVAKITDAVNRGVLRELRDAGIRLAYPTQQLIVERAGV